MEAGEFEPKLGPVDLPAILRRVLEIAAATIDRKSLELGVDIEPGIELVGDEKQIERALQNLVSNAMKFTPGGGQIDVVARADGAEIVDRRARQRIGIPAEEQDELFTRFFSSSGERRAGDARRRPRPLHRQADRRRPRR